jgi:hypothetical protein
MAKLRLGDPTASPGPTYFRPVINGETGKGPAGQYLPLHRRRSRRAGPTDEGVESNARLTAVTAAALLILLAVEGATIIGVGSHLSIHVFVGMVLIPPVALKIGSTSWRFVRYYTGDPAYRAKGPPPVLLRLLGPVLIVLTMLVLGSGVALILAPHDLRGRLLFVHKASFVLWFAVMTVHVLGHIVETARLAPLDWVHRTRAQVEGASARLWTLAASLVVGCLLGLLMLSPTAHYRHRVEPFNSTSGVTAKPSSR